MFARFVWTLFSFCVREFPAKSREEPGYFRWLHLVAVQVTYGQEKPGVAALLDKGVVVLFDEGVVACLDKNNKDDFDVDFILAHPL